jgi:hypothetical protein
MKIEFEIFKKGRELLVNEIIAGLTLDQVNKIPNGFNGNIIWNLGHMVTTHRGLVYQLGGHPSGMEKPFILRYARGSKPEQPVGQEEFDFIKRRLIEQVSEFEKDLAAGIFTNAYKPFTTMTGFEITNHQEAVTFSNFHQAVHIGYVIALKRAI